MANCELGKQCFPLVIFRRDGRGKGEEREKVGRQAKLKVNWFFFSVLAAE